jgi:hypothetical protein
LFAHWLISLLAILPWSLEAPNPATVSASNFRSIPVKLRWSASA